MKGIVSEDLSVKVQFIYYGETKIHYEKLEYFFWQGIDKETTKTQN